MMLGSLVVQLVLALKMTNLNTKFMLKEKVKENVASKL